MTYTFVRRPRAFSGSALRQAALVDKWGSGRVISGLLLENS
jgi:hypothetical protein